MIHRLGQFVQRLESRTVMQGFCLLAFIWGGMTGCVPQTPSDLLYPEDFSATIRLVDKTAPNRSMRVVIEPNRWLRATVGQDAPGSRRYPPRTVQLSDDDLANVHQLLTQLPATDRPYVDELAAKESSELTATYFSNNKAHFSTVDEITNEPSAHELAVLLWEAAGLPSGAASPE